MDKFAETMKALKEMTPEERNSKIASLSEMCICSGCPTYTDCAKKANERMFCNNGKSFMCINTEKSCICGRCPVYSELGLKYQFYCNRGSEKAARYEHTIWGTKTY